MCSMSDAYAILSKQSMTTAVQILFNHQTSSLPFPYNHFRAVADYPPSPSNGDESYKRLLLRDR